MELRDYQKEALDALFNYWKTGQGKNPLVVMPTGSGKSLVIGAFIKTVCSNSHVRILIVTHVKELIEQNQMELLRYWDDARTGIYSAGLGMKQTHAQITFAGIQSIYNHVYDLGKIDIIIVDEAHLIPRTSQTRYQTFLNDMKTANPNICIWGTTATPYRLDSGLLCEGKDALFDGIAYSVDMKKLIKDGYLVSVVSKGGVKKINLVNVHTVAGEYNAKELAYAADDPELIKLAVEEIVAYGEERKAWLVFASGVDHADHVAKEIRKHGVTCEIITGDTDADKRDRVVREYRDGRVRCIVNVMVLTTGFNAPVCDLIALLMATQSTGKYVQIVGCGMRTNPGKQNCLLLDYGSNVTRHGPIDDIDPVKRKNMFGEIKRAAPVKDCPQCHAIIAARCSVCPDCGYEFPVIAQHGTEAYGGAVLSDQSFFVDTSADDGFYVERHKKIGKPDSVKMTFAEGDKEYYLWLLLDHSGFAKERSLGIVKQFGGKAETVDQALKEWPHWRRPAGVMVKPAGKFFEVTGFIFEDKTQSKQMKMEEEQVKSCPTCRWSKESDQDDGYECNLYLEPGNSKCQKWEAIPADRKKVEA
jgi:DNA repair protein RadD